MHIGKALGLGLFLLMESNFSFAQEDANPLLVEYKSYQLYQEKNWKQLKAYGDSAINSGADYYYLRLRVAIAYFELKKYRIAEEYFKKAIAFNSFEDLPKEYLYYCLLYNEKYEESRALTKGFSKQTLFNTRADSLKLIDVIGLDFGLKQASNDLPNALFYQVSLNHYLLNKVSLFHVYSNYSQRSDRFVNVQNQYYISLNVPLKNDFLLTGAFHYLQDDFTVVFNNTHFGGNLHIGALGLKKSLKKFDFGLGSTGIKNDSTIQIQHDVAINFYPKASSFLKIGLNAITYTSDLYKSVHMAFIPTFSINPSTKLKIFSSLLWNQGNNISEWNGFLVNNSPDLTRLRVNLGLNYAITKKLEIGTLLQYERKYSNFQMNNYSYNSIFFSLKYKP